MIRFFSEVQSLNLKSQDFVDDVLVLDTRNDSDRSTAAATDLDVDIEDAFQPLGPENGGVTFSW